MYVLIFLVNSCKYDLVEEILTGVGVLSVGSYEFIHPVTGVGRVNDWGKVVSVRGVTWRTVVALC